MLPLYKYLEGLSRCFGISSSFRREALWGIMITHAYNTILLCVRAPKLTITEVDESVVIANTIPIGHFHKPSVHNQRWQHVKYWTHIALFSYSLALSITTSRLLQAIRALCGDTLKSTARPEQVRATMQTKGHLDEELGPTFEQLVHDAASRGLVSLHDNGRLSLRNSE